MKSSKSETGLIVTFYCNKYRIDLPTRLQLILTSLGLFSTVTPCSISSMLFNVFSILTPDNHSMKNVDDKTMSNNILQNFIFTECGLNYVNIIKVEIKIIPTLTHLYTQCKCTCISDINVVAILARNTIMRMAKSPTHYNNF
jgi:hypothetical protein